MQAVLKFSLPDEERQYRDAVDGGKWKFAMWEFDNKLKAAEKHSDKLSEAASKFREILREIMSDNGVQFE